MNQGMKESENRKGSMHQHHKNETHKGHATDMASEQRDHSAHQRSEHENHEDHSGHEEMFRKRFWISLLLSIPVLVTPITAQ